MRNLTALAVLGLALTACGSPSTSSADPTDQNGFPIGLVSAAFISARADAHLTYPGATVLRTRATGESPQSCSLDGCSDHAADVETLIATQDSATTVRNWYQHALGDRGYVCHGGFEASFMYQLDAYHRGSREEFWVGYIDPQRYHLTYGVQLPVGRTILELDYLIDPSADAGKGRAGGPCYLDLPSTYP
ncbi:MAG: hypothetical protein JOZ75_11380 [Candidatus Dormibacteraeota bacterium]|nr:hypothetical protein [Candidatus Dormibacteraeota bacterium]